ncbi:MAG: aspartate aminotransferase family protein [Phycisphaerales bacterium]
MPIEGAPSRCGNNLQPLEDSIRMTPRRPDTPDFDLAALLAGHAHDALDLQAEYVNPAMAAVLRTIGFDARYVRGEGAYLFDDLGRRYIDCLGGYAVFAAGRNHPVIKDALRQALDADLPNLPGVGTFRTGGILAEQLVRLVPGDARSKPRMVFFASGGAEAMDAALKQARVATGRSGLVYCAKAYHGLTIGSLSVNGNHEFREGFGDLLPGTVEIPFNDLVALEKALAPRDKAAFVVEPIQGKGVNRPDADYLARAAEMCLRHGTLLVLDEIQTGLGRTGRMFAGEHFGMGERWTPDILVIAKALSGGFVPVSAVITRDWIHAKVFPGMNQCARIQTTFSQNDLAMVAGLAALHVIRTEGIVENARDVGEYLMAGLGRMVGRFEMVREVRGHGLMIAIEFQRPRSMMLRAGWEMLHALDPSLFCQAIIMPMMTDHRILTQVAGHKLDVIKLIPPLVLSRADADEIIAAFETCVAACHTFPGPAWEVGKKLSAAALRRTGIKGEPQASGAGA